MTKMLGFFFAVILTVLIFTTVYVQKWNPFTQPQLIRTHFEKTVEGLRKGDTVEVEGIALGKVEHLELAEQGGVIVTLALDDPIELYMGDGRDARTRYEITVESISFLGGNHISIHRGHPGTPKANLSETLIGRTKPSGFEQVGEVMAQNREEIRAFIANASEAFGELKKTAIAINAGEGTIGALLRERKLHDDAVATVEQAKLALTELRESLGGLANKLAGTESTMGKLINTSELHDEMTKTLSEVRKSVVDATAELKAITEKARDPNAGPLGAMLGDVALREDLQRTADNVRQITEDLRKVMEKVSSGEGSLGRLVMDDKLHQDAEKALENLDKSFGRAARSIVTVYGESRQYTDSEVSISKLGIRITPDDSKYFYAGASFISLDHEADTVRFEKQMEENDDDTLIKIDAGVMYRIPWFFDNHVGLRAGMIEGKPGGAIEIDYDLFEGYPIHAVLEVRDAYNDLDDEDLDEEVRGPMARAWVRIPLWKRGDAWWEQVLHSMRLFAGASRLQDDPEFMVGIGFEYRDEDIRTLVGLLGTAR